METSSKFHIVIVEFWIFLSFPCFSYNIYFQWKLFANHDYHFLHNPSSHLWPSGQMEQAAPFLYMDFPEYKCQIGKQNSKWIA